MTHRICTLLPAFFAALLLTFTPMVNAQANPLLGEKLTLRDENKLGREFDQVIRSQMGMVGDTYITDFVTDVVNRIVDGKRPMPYTVKSAVIANPIMNAFAIPGGFIYIFTGLIQEVTTEAQLAGVISHELAHVSQRHVVHRIEKQKKIGLLSTVGVLTGLLLGIASGSGDAGKIGTAIAMGSSGAATQAMLNYSREDENEADHVGLNALVKAGYNPQGMPQMFEIMQKNKWFDSGSHMPAYLSTHPGTDDRITYLNDRIARMPKEFSQRTDDNTRLHRVQVLVRGHMSPPKSALAYWNDKMATGLTPMEHAGRGITLSRLKKMDEAQKAFETALAQDSNDPLISREAGIFYFKTGQADKAFPLLQKATIQNSRDAIGLFYLARLQSEAKQYRQAIANMQKVEKLVPEDWEVHHHLGMILGESGDTFGGNVHLAYGGLYSMNMRKAKLHAQKATALAQTDAQKETVKQLEERIKERAELTK
ncbi:M48 family metalloprotease [Pseudodesulfovibrio sp. JC047]|uniref:beta-barrel assembly-enhancing protease n=1 Tax=Pseudodesulfovibrio sp. JC047 TaxID=2683199 RepID=UPI0013D045BD|nr:M48 family metallopeptidase [Pseudodesulfovibrio sp. JC047]NDV19413.1 M48 family metalloprotease [Pseudodesulfovibrio sp. JC047]